LTAIADLLEQKGLISQAEIAQIISANESIERTAQATAQEWRNNLKLFTLRSEIQRPNN
jgi:hypothetical protein